MKGQDRKHRIQEESEVSDLSRSKDKVVIIWDGEGYRGNRFRGENEEGRSACCIQDAC